MCNWILNEKKLSIYAFLVSIISLFISYKAYQLSESTNHLHIIPNIELTYIQDKNSDHLVIKNKSPVEIVSLSINYKAYGFDKERNEYKIAAAGNKNIFDDLGENWIYKDKLGPNESINEYLGELSSGSESPSKQLIIARVFDITYFRPADMNKFQKRSVFFIDGNTIYSYAEAMKTKHLTRPVQKLDEFINKISKIPDVTPLNINIKKVNIK